MMAEVDIQNILKLLLTPDGKGRKVKADALIEIAPEYKTEIEQFLKTKP